MAASKNLSPEQRSERARQAALAMHAQGKTNTDGARAAWFARFERDVDPEGVLSEDERACRAVAAMKAHVARRKAGGPA